MDAARMLSQFGCIDDAVGDLSIAPVGMLMWYQAACYLCMDIERSKMSSG